MEKLLNLKAMRFVITGLLLRGRYCVIITCSSMLNYNCTASGDVQDKTSCLEGGGGGVEGVQKNSQGLGMSL